MNSLYCIIQNNQVSFVFSGVKVKKLLMSECLQFTRFYSLIKAGIRIIVFCRFSFSSYSSSFSYSFYNYYYYYYYSSSPCHELVPPISRRPLVQSQPNFTGKLILIQSLDIQSGGFFLNGSRYHGNWKRWELIQRLKISKMSVLHFSFWRLFCIHHFIILYFLILLWSLMQVVII